MWPLQEHFSCVVDMKGEVLPTCNQLQYSSLFTGQCLLASCNRQQVVCSRYICDTSSTRFCKSPSCHAEAHSHGYMVPPDIALLLDHIFQLSFIPASDLGVGTDIPHPVIQSFRALLLVPAVLWWSWNTSLPHSVANSFTTWSALWPCTLCSLQAASSWVPSQ